MPRRPRLNLPGRVYHLIPRFVDREWFITCEEERATYLRLFGRAISRSDWRCIAYAVMSNHIHLGLIPGVQRLDSWIRSAHAPFADWMNKRHDRIGPLFVRGPKDFLVAPDRVRNVIAYIHNNPVRARIVAQASLSDWTSHGAYLAPATSPPWLDVAEGLWLSGFDGGRAFNAWVDDPQSNPPDEDLHEGGPSSTRSPKDSIERGALQRGAPRASGNQIVRATADYLGISLAELCSSRRGRLQQLGREVAIRCAVVVGLPGTAIAAALAISQQGESSIRRRTPSRPVVGEVSSRVLAIVSDAKVWK